MNPTTLHDDSRPSPRTALWISTGLLLLMAIGMVALRGSGPMSNALALAMAGLGAACTLGMAGILQNASAYPRWATWTTGAVMAAAMLLSVPLAGDPLEWSERYRLNAWLLPSFLLVMGTTPGAKRGVCAPTHPGAGWIMVGTGILLSVILLGAPAIARWIAAGAAG